MYLEWREVAYVQNNVKSGNDCSALINGLTFSLQTIIHSHLYFIHAVSAA